MALFLYSLTDEGKVNFCKIAHKLGVDVKKLEQEAAHLDKAMEKGEQDLEPVVGQPHLEDTEDIGKIMSEAPHYRGKPG